MYARPKEVVLLFSFLLIAIAPLLAQKQLGKPFITNYSYQDYDGNPVNWWALEDKDGMMYFANSTSVLQYDGVNWNIIDGNAGARCMVKDPDGTIYVGGGGDIG